MLQRPFCKEESKELTAPRGSLSLFLARSMQPAAHCAVPSKKKSLMSRRTRAVNARRFHLTSLAINKRRDYNRGASAIMQKSECALQHRAALSARARATSTD